MVTRREDRVRQRVISARKKARLTHKEVGEALGLTESGYGHYERGRQSFSLEMLFRLSDLLQKPVTWFLGIKTDLAEDEEELLHAYRQISDDRIKALLLNMAKDASKDE